MKRIEKLTKEQEALMPVCRDYWISKGLQTGETDWETAEKNIKLAYEKANLIAPKIVVRVNSPIVGGLTASILDNYFKGDAVGGAVDDAVGVAVGVAVDGAVGGAVRVAIGGAVRDAIGGAVDDAVGVAVGGAVRDAVGVAIGGAELKWHEWLGGQFWVGGWYWGTAYPSFFIDYCKLQVSQDIKERFEIYKAINSSCNYVWLNSNFIIICARPKSINLQNNRLHCINGKSIEYSDGWGLYHLYGVRFEEALYNKVVSKELTFEEWSKESNEEIKSAILSFYEDNFGGEFVYRFLSKYIKEVDTHVDKKSSQYLKGTVESMNVGVYTLFKGKVNSIDIAYVRCYCPSTDRMFFLGVHPDFTTAKDAIASLCQVPVKLKPHLVSIARQGEIFSFNFDKKGTELLKSKKLTPEDYAEVISLKGDEYFEKMKFEY